MPGVDEAIVREFFEGNGFLVRQLQKYPLSPRKKSKDAGTSLLVLNPAFRPADRPPNFLLFSSELPLVEKAVVLLPGRPAGRFALGSFKSGAKLYRLLEKMVGELPADLDSPEEELEVTGTVLRILVLPGLPTGEPYRTQSRDLLRSRGIDGIVSFRSMLLEVVGRVETDRDYRNSALLDTIRVLKNYEMIKESQMELFDGMGD